jgi:hypothetical protein
LLGTSLFVTEYRARMKHWLVKLGSQKLCIYSYFPKDTAYTVLFKEMVSINHWHLIKFLEPFFEEIVILFLEPLFLELECSYSLGMDLWWITLEYQTWIISIPPFRHKQGTYPCICIDREHSSNHWNCKYVKLSRSVFYTITVLPHICHMCTHTHTHAHAHKRERERGKDKMIPK